MPNPNDPQIKQQIQQKEQEIADADERGEDTTQMEADLAALQQQQKQAREQNRANRPQGGQGQGQGRSTAPGQQGKEKG